MKSFLISLVAVLLLVVSVPVQAQEVPPEVQEIKKLIRGQIAILDGYAQFFELYDHFRLNYLKDSAADLLNALETNWFVVSDNTYLTTLRRFEYAKETLVYLAPRVAKAPFENLFRLAKQWADKKGIKDEPARETSELLGAIERPLTEISTILFEYSRAGSDKDDKTIAAKRAKAREIADSIADLIKGNPDLAQEALAIMHTKAFSRGDKAKVYLSTIPFFHQLQLLLHELVEWDPYGTSELGKRYQLLIGLVEGFIDNQGLRELIEEHDQKFRQKQKDVRLPKAEKKKS